ncbi:hypothetical protein MKW98_023199 [Papaver atlanticum]|uniref:F-box domain-containing protein n=1 Tax=Papaver atlanticum TaxID=357466 RepID=A0AAD4XFL5_9MAGN|nr:hypothetical protein MKW98_023199 [Papaver atlanticum]
MISKGINSLSDVKVQSENKSGHIKHLPYDILLDIFSRVPVESVLDCKLVCKNWLSLLTRKRTYFTDMHVRRQLNQLRNGGDAANVDSGLLCARSVDGNNQEVALFYGGRYNDKINTDEQYTYKTTLKKIRHPRMRFHTPREYLWLWVRFPWGCYEMPGIFANEVIYWVNGFNIYSFDLVNEEFQIVPTLPCFTDAVSGGYVRSHFGLVVLGGNLCFYYQNLITPDIEIWSLKNKIWIKDFSTVYEMNEKYKTSFTPILLTRKGEVIFSMLECWFYCYNPRTASWKLLVDDDGVDEIITTPHVNTFVSLKTIGEKPRRRRSCEILSDRDGGYL